MLFILSSQYWDYLLRKETNYGKKSNYYWRFGRKKKRHEKDAKHGWYRYDVRFAIPVHDDKTGEVLRYNIFFARMLVRHADDGKKYLYDLLAVKKEK